MCKNSSFISKINTISYESKQMVLCKGERAKESNNRAHEYCFHEQKLKGKIHREGRLRRAVREVKDSIKGRGSMKRVPLLQECNVSEISTSGRCAFLGEQRQEHALVYD